MLIPAAIKDVLDYNPTTGWFTWKIRLKGSPAREIGDRAGNLSLGNKWMAAIKVQGNQYYLGGFSNPEDAGNAYAQASYKVNGEFAHAG